jgi:thioredoxin-like negative regulator of GroEL
MKRKQQFLQAIQIMAPNDSFVIQAAERVSEETLPVAPGGAALEFVVAMERLKNSVGFTGAENNEMFDGTQLFDGQMQLKDALCVKSAEYWLKLGQPAQALAVMEALPESMQRHSWVVKVRVAAVGAAKTQHDFPSRVE